MKKLVAAITIALSLQAKADLVVTNLNTFTVTSPQVVTTVTTNTMTVKDVKIVWTSFTISYAPPAYTQAVYTVSYILQDLKTRREIPRSRGVKRMDEREVASFATAKGADFPRLGQGIGSLVNEYLKTLFAQPSPVRERPSE